MPEMQSKPFENREEIRCFPDAMCGGAHDRAFRTRTRRTNSEMRWFEGSVVRGSSVRGSAHEAANREPSNHAASKADPRSKLCLPARAQVVAVERPLEGGRVDRRKVERFLAGRGVDAAVTDGDRAAQVRVVAPAPVVVQQIQQEIG